MSLTIEEKKAVVAEVSEKISDAQAAVLAEYRGLTVAQKTDLRRKAQASGVYLRVVKNTLARRVVDGTDFACLSEHLVGPLAFAMSPDPVAAAKVISNFAKDNDQLNITVGAMSGAVMSIDEIKALARLPSREELLAKLLGTMQAPIQTFVRTLNEVPSGFVRTLAAVRDSKEAA